MLNNLRAELVRKGIPNGRIANRIAEILGCTTKTARDKLNGKFSFSFPEASKIRQTLFPDLSLEYLFEEDGERVENERHDEDTA